MELNKNSEESLKQEYGKRLKECITAVKMTQSQVAKESGFTQQYISNIIRGLKPMTVTAARTLSKVLNVREEYLLCEDNYRTDREIFTTSANLHQESRNITTKLLNMAGYKITCSFIENWEELGLNDVMKEYLENNEKCIGRHVPFEFANRIRLSCELIAPNGKKFYCDYEDIALLQYELLEYINMRMTQLESKFAWKYDDCKINLKVPGSEMEFFKPSIETGNWDEFGSNLWIDHEYDDFPDLERLEKYYEDEEE